MALANAGLDDCHRFQDGRKEPGALTPGGEPSLDFRGPSNGAPELKRTMVRAFGPDDLNAA